MQTVLRTFSVSEPLGGWPQVQSQWNPNTQSFDRYVYSDQGWMLIPNAADPQQSVPGLGGGSTLGFTADPVYQGHWIRLFLSLKIIDFDEKFPFVEVRERILM